MTKTEHEFLSLLSDGLSGASTQSLVTSWKDTIDIANKHSVSLIIYSAILHRMDVPEDVKTAFRNNAIASTLNNERILHVQDLLLSQLKMHDVDAVIYKGASVAVCYRNPTMRSMGDIDVLVNQTSLDEVDSIFANEGCTPVSSHGFHRTYQWHGVHIEIHWAVSLFPDNSKGRVTSALMDNALRDRDWAQIDDHRFPVMLPIYQIISLLAHMERHMYSSNIGLRQLCDWVVTMQKYGQSFGKEEIDILTQCGLFRFAKAITKVCILYFALQPLEWCEDVSDGLANMTINEIMSGGNIVFSSKERSISKMLIEHNNGYSSCLINYIHNVNKKVRDKWPRSSKFCIIYPLFWVYYPLRWSIYVLLGKRKRVSIGETYGIARNRARLYKSLSIFK